jgi:superfamily II DNA/RNA helicase
LNFNEFGLDHRLLDGIGAIGYEAATPVQEQVIPPIIGGKDLIASAQTGTGKTAAYLLPIIHKLISSETDGHVKALVIVPTRELAVQIEQQMQGFSYFTSLSSIAIYGGGDGNIFTQEKQALSEGTDVVICTPGRMIAHLNLGYVNITGLEYLVLDEADRMLDMGFHDDIMKIISFLPKKRQNLLFSATMPPKIRDLARKILHHPIEINIAISKPPEKIVQEAYVVYEPQKIPLVKHLLLEKNFRSVIVFCSTKSNVKQLTRELKRTKLNVDEIHSDLDQDTRENVLLKFKSRQLSVLVATDILSRGIDIEDIDLVVNFDIPHDGEDYVHRVGRTARAESDGEAITLVTDREQNKFAAIERLLGHEVTKALVPEQFGEVPVYDPRGFKHHSKPGKKKFGKFKGKKSGKSWDSRGGKSQNTQATDHSR